MDIGVILLHHLWYLVSCTLLAKGASMVKWTKIMTQYSKTIIFFVKGLKVVARYPGGGTHNKFLETPATTPYFQGGVLSLRIRVLGVLKVEKNLLS